MNGLDAAPSLGRMTPTDLHVLLVLRERDSYAYAIMKAVSDESAGAVRLEVGSVYRIMARLARDGLVKETDRADEEAAPGHPRKYYRLTDLGLHAARTEAQRLRRVVRLARQRGVLPERGP